MVSKKLYDSFFGGYSKPQVYVVDEDKDEDSFENCERGSYGSTVVKKTVIYESETVKFIDQSDEDFTPSVPVHAFHPVSNFIFLYIFKILLVINQ
jgi:hypothetical protein